MAKLKPTDKEQSIRVTKAAIAGNQELYGVSDELLSSKAGFTTRTLQNRRIHPENFTLEELWAVSKTLKLTPIQAASIVMGRALTSKEVKEFILL